MWLSAEFNLSCRKKCLFKDLLSYLLYVDDFHHLQIYLQRKKFEFFQINGAGAGRHLAKYEFDEQQGGCRVEIIIAIVAIIYDLHLACCY